MTLSEAELVNAICLHLAERRGIRPEDIHVELVYDDDTGFSAEITAGGRDLIWIEANMAEAVSRYVHKQYGIQAYREQIVFDITDEMVVHIQQ